MQLSHMPWKSLNFVPKASFEEIEKYRKISVAQVEIPDFKDGKGTY